MTIKKAIDRADSTAANTTPLDQKIEWLSTLDHMIYTKIISTHEDASVDSFGGYTPETALTTELLIGEPWDELYVYWLLAKIAEANNEDNGYNKYTAQYNALYDDFAAWYNRTHYPITTAREVFF